MKGRRTREKQWNRRGGGEEEENNRIVVVSLLENKRGGTLVKLSNLNRAKRTLTAMKQQMLIRTTGQSLSLKIAANIARIPMCAEQQFGNAANALETITTRFVQCAISHPFENAKIYEGDHYSMS